MRTTITLDDVAAAIGRMRLEEGISMSDAVNRLKRAGLALHALQGSYQHRSASIGLTIDVTDTGAVVDFLDEL